MKAWPHIPRQRSGWPGLLTLLLGSLLLVWAVHLLKPLYDNDFYWHLKTGCWIWDHRALPAVDPFSIPPQVEDPHRTRFMLSSYWLFQLVLAAFYKTAGFGGIIVFRFLLAAVLIAVFYRFSARKEPFTALVAGIGITQLLELYFPERPQFISFVCCALLLAILLTHLKERRVGVWSLLIPLCLTMVLWANTHGGFLLGVILLLFILLAEAVKFIHPQLEPLTGREYLHLAAAICPAIFVSLLNPNHIFSFEIMKSYAEASDLIHTATLENANLYEYFTLAGGAQPAITICTCLVTLIVFFSSREQTNITWGGLLLLLGGMGLLHVRYYAFFLIMATLLAIRHLDTAAPGKLFKAAAVAFLVTVVAVSLIKTPKNLKTLSSYGFIPAAYFPVKVCDYLVEHGIKGNLFTTLDWGGYVLWRSAPERKIFIDGRHLYPLRSWEYFYYMENWQTLFDKYDIRVVILPTYEAPGRLFAATGRLEADPAWQLVDRNNNAALFVRK